MMHHDDHDDHEDHDHDDDHDDHDDHVCLLFNVLLVCLRSSISRPSI